MRVWRATEIESSFQTLWPRAELGSMPLHDTLGLDHSESFPSLAADLDGGLYVCLVFSCQEPQAVTSQPVLGYILGCPNKLLLGEA
jgi:hypothetical protein